MIAESLIALEGTAGFAVIAATGLLAATIAAVMGTGGGIVLLPVLVAVLGVRDAVPAYTLAAFLGNLSRLGLNRAAIDGRVVRWFALGAVPAAIAGGLLFARTDDAVLVRLLGGFLLATVAWRRLRRARPAGFPAPRFAAVGAIFAFVSALVGSAGPFLAPFFLGYGLVRASYIGTEALATGVMHVAKMSTYAIDGVFGGRAVATGLGLGPVMLLGAAIGRRIVDRLPERAFVAVIELALLGFGLWFLVRG